jgi:hypothetical protein
MRIEIERERIKIVPEGIADEIYLELVLGLKTEGSEAKCTRRNTRGVLKEGFAIEITTRVQT